MKNKSNKALHPSKIKDIDFSDIAELDEAFWERAKLVKPAPAK